MKLTAAEEKALKAQRRRVVNRQSAMRSRKRRSQYIHYLEQKVNDCTDEIKRLEREVKKLRAAQMK